MKTTRFVHVVAALAFCTASVQSAPVISNPAAAQRPGTKLVDIDYNLTGTTNPVTITLEISADGGTTWAVPATALTGAVGPNVTPGSNLRITWDAGVDWNNQLSNQMRFRLKGSDPNFALVPAGTFTMGDALDGMTDAPPHTVNVSTFYMQKLGVTKADWDAVRAWGLLHSYTDLAIGAGKAADHPVQSVSWYDVVKWCNAKSEKDGLAPCYYTDVDRTVVYRTGNTDITNTMVNWAANGYRLPTEAEREMAARGGLAGLRFPWGNTISHANANFYNNGGESYQTGSTGYHPTYGTGSAPYTSPVGSFAANGSGIYDMAGNVWEWCWDWYGAGYYGVSPGTDPAGPSGSYRVFRGGSCNGSAYDCHSAYRNDGSPGYSNTSIGFRPVRATLVVTADSQPDITVDTRDWVKLTIIANGTTDPTPGDHQVPKNSDVVLTAGAPNGGYLPFSKWTIGTSGSATTSTANPLSVTMDSDKTITAVFAQDTRDPDGDGLTNYEEIVIWDTDPNIADMDGDGFSDGYEVHHGTKPKDPGSRPDATLTIFLTAVEVRLDTALGQSYRIESSTDLQNWIIAEEHIVGTGGTVTRFYSVQEIPRRYFRPVRE